MPQPAPPAPGPVTFSDGALSGASWEGVVADAVARIDAGDLEKVVLAIDLVATAPGPIDVRWPLRRLAASYPMCWTFHVDGMFGATPELLVRREKGLVTSRVLAGTIRRTGDDERDLSLAATLARSSKDLEEHEYAVRSVADSLAPYCDSMNLPDAPFVLHLPNVMHLATDVTAVVHDPAQQRVNELQGGRQRPRAGRGPAPLRGRGRHPDQGRGRADRGDRGHAARRLRGTRRLDGRTRRRRVRHRAALAPSSTATPSGSSPAAASSAAPTRRPSWPRRRRSWCRCGTPSASRPHTRQDAVMERFDLSDPAFDVTSERVHAAREESWYVETNWGWAVLRYAEASALLKDRRFRQGNARWPAQNGIHSGHVQRLVAGDAAQPRGRRPQPDPAAADARLPQQGDRRDAAALPGARERAHRRVRGRGTGRVRLPVRGAVRLPDHLRAARAAGGRLAARWRTGPTTSASRSASAWPTTCRRSRRHSTACAGTWTSVVADRVAHPQDDLVTTLVQAVDEEGGGRLSRHELGVVAGVPRLRGHGDHPQPARARGADAARAPRPVARCWASGPSSAVRPSRR